MFRNREQRECFIKPEARYPSTKSLYKGRAGFSRKKKKKIENLWVFLFYLCNKHTSTEHSVKRDFWDSFSDSDGIGWALNLECSAFKALAARGTGLWKPEPFQPFLTFFSHSFFRDSALWSDIFFSSLICFSLVCRMTWDSRSRLWTTGERGRQTQTFRPGRRASLCLLAPQAAPNSTILLDSKVKIKNKSK